MHDSCGNEADDSQIQLIAMRDRAVTTMRLLYETNAGKRHMKTNDKDLVGRNRIQDTLAGCRRHLLIIIDVEMDVRSLQ